MTVKELQKELADAINGVEELVQRGCKAFAEDTRDIYKESDKWVSAGKTAIVVVTPERRRNGGAPGAPVAETTVKIQCSERPALARTRQDSITALDAGEAVMLALDGPRFCWLSSSQTLDRATGTLTDTETFATSFIAG